MSTQQREPTVLILGAGIFGTSTAYHLAQHYTDGTRITVVDRSPSPPTHGASTDINKIIRADYTSRFYCDLAYDAINAWQTWDMLRPYYHQSGWIALPKTDSDVTDRIQQTLRERGYDPTEDVPLSELERRWGGVLKGTDLVGFKDGYWNPEAGWCDASAATHSLMQKTLRYGVQYVVADIEELVLGDGEIAGVKTTDGKLLTADRILLATGAWTSSILSPIEDQLKIPTTDRVETQVKAAGVAVSHYKLSSSEMDQLSSMPVVVYGENGEVIPPPKSSQLLKYTNSLTFTNTITTPTGHRISVPPNRDQHIISRKLARETAEMMSSKVMPAFTCNKQPDYHRLCWDSYTPTQDWLLTKHPDARLSNLYLAVGGSFHSYKFLPTAGLYMLNVLRGVSNGEEKDKAWSWKDFSSEEWAGKRGAHESTAPGRELSELEDDDDESGKKTAKL